MVHVSSTCVDAINMFVCRAHPACWCGGVVFMCGSGLGVLVLLNDNLILISS